jgi:hypothetical protein
VRRRLSTILSAVSLLLCIATAALWARSRSYYESYCVARANWGFVVHVSGGEAALEWMYVPRGEGNFCWNMDLQGQPDPISTADPNPMGATDYVRMRPDFAWLGNPNVMLPPALAWHRFSFLQSRFITTGFGESPIEFTPTAQAAPVLTAATMTFVGVGLPLWAVMLMTAVLPAAWLAAKLRRRRYRAPGQCAACGYDLRATPGRCPECGAVPRTAPLIPSPGTPGEG